MAERVLLITGDDTLVRLVATVAVGAELLREADGYGGLAACERARPDVVIWDEDLAGPPAAVSRLVATGAGVVVIAGRGGMAAGVRALREGADQFVLRPCDPEAP